MDPPRCVLGGDGCAGWGISLPVFGTICFSSVSTRVPSVVTVVTTWDSVSMLGSCFPNTAASKPASICRGSSAGCSRIAGASTSILFSSYNQTHKYICAHTIHICALVLSLLSMGWGARNKHVFFKGVKLRPKSTPLRYNTLVVDVSIAIQSTLPTSSNMTPMEYIEKVFWPSIRANVHSHVILCFDKAKFMPQVRFDVLYPERYKKVPYVGDVPGKTYCEKRERYFNTDQFPVSDEIAALLTPTNLSAPWAQLMNGAKEKVYSVFEECLIQIVSRADGDCTYLIDRQDGTRYPVDSPVPTIPLYGEGDPQTVHYALAMCGQGSVLVRSGDWDVPLALAGYRHENIHVLQATVYADDESLRVYNKKHVAYRACDARKRWGSSYHAMHQIVDTGDLQSLSWTQRINYVFWALAAGGADYCKGGLATFGFTEAPVLEIALRHNTTVFEFVFDDEYPMEKTLRFYPAVLINTLRRMKRKAKSEDSVALFSNRMHYIIYNMRYYFGCDSQQVPAGPLPPPLEFQLFEGETVTQLLSRESVEKPIDFHEEAPWKEVGYAAAVYDEEQLQALKE